jgi:predicted DNA-binding transcriptional regulator YafY
MTAAHRFARLLRLLPRVADGQPRRVADVARDLRVPMAQVRQDLVSLAERVEDTSGAFVEGVRVLLDRDTVTVHSRWFRRPLGLSPDEVAAVALGLAVLEQEGPADALPAVRQARSKLAALGAAPMVAPVLSRTRPVRAAPRAMAPAAAREARFLATLQRAWVARTEVHLTYRKQGARTPERRVVRPWRLIFARGAWFVVGEDAARADLRVFRLDRIEGLRVGAATYRVPEGFSVEQVVRDGRVFTGAGAGTLVVRYGPAVARWIAEREPHTALPDGSVTVQYPLADDAWAVRHVLRYGPDALVLEPERVREQVRRTLMRLA